jgi:hypothetical protein
METKTYIRVCTECGYKQMGYPPYTGECPACNAVLNTEKASIRPHPTDARYKIVTWHGEHISYFYVTDAHAHKDEQPKVMETCTTRDDAEIKCARYNRARRVPILCGCGWGHLGMLETELPEYCPRCGHDFTA